MYVYQEKKENFFHNIHPLTAILYIFTICLFSLIFSHPVYLLALFIAISTVIISAEIYQEWKVYLKFSIWFIIILVFVNSLLVRTGTTVLFWGPRIPLLGQVRITLESILFVLGMGLRFLVIISAFCLYTYALHPDKIFKLMGRWGNKSVLALTLSTRLFPLMVGDYQRIIEVQKCRGVDFKGKGFWQKAQKYIPVMNIMLLSSLERSWQLAESLHSRGYGLKNRSYYSRELWRLRDYMIICILIISILIGIFMSFKGWTGYSYYPRIQTVAFIEVIPAGILTILFMFPALLCWGCRKWPLLRLKI